MGNNPNQVIQCGFADKDLKKEIETTKEYAIKHQRSDFNEKLSTSNFSDDRIPKLESMPKKKQYSVPEHESLTIVSSDSVPGLVLVPEFNIYEEQDKGRCLDEIIQSRYHTTMHFPEPQMVSLLESLVYGLAYLSKKNIPHHDFYPTNIFYKDGKFKLLNPAALSDSSYSITQQRKRFSFLSPQLIVEVLNDTKEENIPIQILDKSDVFAIGMILLQFCTLQPSSECYDAQTYNIIDSVIQERVNKCSTIYNPLLSQCIDLMLQYEVDKRIPPQQLSYAVHSTLSNLKVNVKPMPPQPDRMSMSGKVSPQMTQQMPIHQLPPNMVHTRLPTGEIIVGLPPGLVQGGPNIHMPQQPIQHQFSTQPHHKIEQMRVEKMKLNPFEQIQEEDNEENQKKEVPLSAQKNEGEKESLDERVQRILEASRTIK